MNKADIEFKIGLNTSPAEQQLYSLGEKMKSTAHIYNDVFKDVGQGFKTVGTPYQNSNNYNVPSTQVLERSLAMVENSMEKFARIVEQISVRMVNFQTVGSSYTNAPNTIYASNRVAGYLPSSTSSNVRPWFPAEHYTRSQVDAINDPNKVFNYLVNRRREDNPYVGIYDTFSRLQNTQGMYGVWKGTFGNNYDFAKNVLGLPAPQQEQKMHPWQERNMADVNKNDNIELKEKLLLWSKILAVVYSVKKVIEGLVRAWKFGADTATSRNSNINEELGFFSTDPVGAMNANVDKTRSMLYAGVRNMGANAPVSKAGLDYATNKITEMWTAAMSGRNVDARTTIDAQRLKDFFGIDLTVAGLLTGEREGKTATDIQIDMMEKVEKQLSKLSEADDITKGQVIDSLKNILGSELIDAIVSNYNKNLKIEIGDRLTLSERLLGAGGSALSSQDLTAKTTSAVTALTDFQTALENLKNTITVTFAPAFVSVTNTLTDFVNWLNRKMTKTTGAKDETGGYSSDVAPEAIKSSGHLNWISKSSNSGNVFGTPSERANKVNELLKNATSVNDVLDAVYLLNPFVQTEGDIEGLKTRKFAREAGSALISGKIDPNSNNPFIRKIANYEYGGKVGVDAFKQAIMMGEFGNINDMKFLSSLVFDPSEFEDKTVEDFLPKKYESMSGDKKAKAYEKALKALEKYNYNKNKKKFAAVNQLMSTDVFGRWVIELFGEGGAYDLKEDESLSSYLFDPSSYETPEDYYNALKSLKESFDANRWGREYIQSLELPSMEELAGADKKLDFGEVKLRLTLTDQAGTVLGSQEVIGSVQ